MTTYFDGIGMKSFSSEMEQLVKQGADLRASSEIAKQYRIQLIWGYSIGPGNAVRNYNSLKLRRVKKQVVQLFKKETEGFTLEARAAYDTAINEKCVKLSLEILAKKGVKPGFEKEDVQKETEMTALMSQSE